MDTKQICCILLVLISCQHGVSYRIYILPEPGAFCLGVFSGDACLTWSEYSANPIFVDHSTTLIFTPGSYQRYSTLSVANVRHFTMIGDGAHIQFGLSLSNIGYVGMHNLTFANRARSSYYYSRNNPTISIRNIRSFVMENCALSLSQNSGSVVGLYLYSANSKIIESTFNGTSTDARCSQSSPTLLVTRSTFTNSSYIIGNSYCNVTIHSSRFVNNYVSSSQSGVVSTRGLLTIVNCLFERNSALSSRGIVNSDGDVTVLNSNFTSNEAAYVSNSYYSRLRFTYYRGGRAISGQGNINISDCTFSYYTQSHSVVYSRRYSSYYGRQSVYRVYITNSLFYHNNRTVYSYNDVIVKNSSFYNSTAMSGDGRAIYSTMSVTTVNCTFINSTTINGNGGAVYSGQNMIVLYSTFISSSTNHGVSYYHSGGSGGTLYSQQATSITNCTISDSIAVRDGGVVYSTHSVTVTNASVNNSAAHSGRGGAIYGSDVKITNSILRNTIARTDGGAVYGMQNVTAINIVFSNSTASIGNGGAICNGNDVMIINCTITKCSALSGKGGAVYSRAASGSGVIFNPNPKPNVFFSRSLFSHNSASSGGILYVNGHYSHHMEFTDSTFVFNEATGNFTGGGVAFFKNTSLVITNSVFNNNMAATNGGVLDMSFSSVRIELSSLSHNTANGNGGVFYAQNYTTNFTVVQTIFKNNAAENGGVLYVRRFNSNIKLVDSTFTENSATNHGGVMDIRGVTLVMDMDTVIANNTADVSGNVISACISQITAYGLEVQPDPIYPMYCSDYDEGNRSYTGAPKSESVSTGSSTSSSLVTEQVSTTSLLHTSTSEPEVDVAITTEEGTTTSHASEGTTTSPSNTPHNMITNSYFRGNTLAHTSEVTTSSASSNTEPWTNGLTTKSGKATDQTSSTTSPELASTHSKTDGLTTNSEKVTSAAVQAITAADTTIMTDSAASTDDDWSTTESMNHMRMTTTRPQNERETRTPGVRSSESTTFEVTTQMVASPSDGDEKFTESGSRVTGPRFPQSQADQDEYDTWSNQQEFVQVAIISLAVLCIVCASVCIIMAVLFYMACKRKNVRLRGHYKELPLRDDQETHDGTQEYSFVEIQPHHATSALSQQDEKL